jgi:cellulose biosynthesis protein BcsQ
MIVSFVQTKGGTGKSTLSMNSAFSRNVSTRFSSIALVELDPQGTLQSWWKSRVDENRHSGNVSFHHISSTQKEVIQDGITSIAGHNELLILDIPGESTSRLHTKFACAFSDRVIVPMRTSTNDESAFKDNLLPVIKEIIKVTPEKKRTFQILPSFTNAQSNKDKVIEYFQDVLPDYVECLPVVYPSRSIYENFNRDGMNLIEYTESLKKNKRAHQQALKAVEDIEEIAAAIFNFTEK